MSQKVVTTCDHCGEVVPPYINHHWSASIFTIGPSMPELHGCTKEHLGLALAKAFGIPTNDTAKQLVAEAEARTANAWKNLETSQNARNTAEIRVADLEKRLAAANNRLALADTASITDNTKPTKPARIAINPREVIEEPALESVFCECDRMVLPNGTIKHLPHCPLSEEP